MKETRKRKLVWNPPSTVSATLVDRIVGAAARHNPGLLLFVVCFAVAAVGIFVVRDLQKASA